MRKNSGTVGTQEKGYCCSKSYERGATVPLGTQAVGHGTVANVVRLHGKKGREGAAQRRFCDLRRCGVISNDNRQENYKKRDMKSDKIVAELADKLKRLDIKELTTSPVTPPLGGVTPRFGGVIANGGHGLGCSLTSEIASAHWRIHGADHLDHLGKCPRILRVLEKIILSALKGTAKPQAWMKSLIMLITLGNARGFYDFSRRSP